MSAPVDIAAQRAGGHAPPARTPGRGNGTPGAGTPRTRSVRGVITTLAVALLVVAGCLPYTTVMTGPGTLSPLITAGLLAVVVSFVVRLVGFGPFISLLASGAAWAVWAGSVFVPHTLAFGVVPTFEFLGETIQLWAQGVELIRIRPAPVYAEAPIMLIVTTGVWAVTFVIDAFVFRLGAPLRGIAMALVLWTVPLTLSSQPADLWALAGTFLLSGAAVMLATTGTNGEWGPFVGPSRGRGSVTVITGCVMALMAIGIGGSFASSVPGFQDAPWLDIRSSGGPTITTNPIVSVRPSLVGTDDVEVMRVHTPQPVYMRLTALDRYENEEWTTDGISAGRATGNLPLENDIPYARELNVTVEAANLSEAVLMPAPYHPIAVDTSASDDADDPIADRLQFDRAGATFTLSDPGIEPGQQYSVTSAIPEPSVDELRSASHDGVDPALTALPNNVPEDVIALARQIVDEAGAQTPVDQALAIQEELQSWEYSLSPPQGHGRNAMVAFINNRIGYCEQYAGTMAVMLRSLGIPSRVAVGYTPGELQPDGTFLITNANAHAWVEVLFPEQGWVSFEPTPRSDGNVLVPSVTAMAPQETEVAQDIPEEPALDGGAQGLTPEEEQRLMEERDLAAQQQRDAQLDGPESGQGSGASGSADTSPMRWLLPLLVALSAITAWIVTGHRRGAGLDGAQQVLRLADGTEEFAAGIGQERRPDETDAEFLARVSGADPAGKRFADAISEARFAPSPNGQSARDAERDAGYIRGLMAETVSAPRRWLAPHLGRAQLMVGRLRDR